VTWLIKEAIRQAPSSFNSQSSRAVLLFGAQSEKFWSLTKEALRAMVPADQFASTEAKMDGFAAGVGTVLFYEDQEVIKSLQQTYPLYADAFPGFSAHSAGMAQYAVWRCWPTPASAPAAALQPGNRGCRGRCVERAGLMGGHRADAVRLQRGSHRREKLH